MWASLFLSSLFQNTNTLETTAVRKICWEHVSLPCNGWRLWFIMSHFIRTRLKDLTQVLFILFFLLTGFQNNILLNLLSAKLRTVTLLLFPSLPLGALVFLQPVIMFLYLISCYCHFVQISGDVSFSCPWCRWPWFFSVASSGSVPACAAVSPPPWVWGCFIF